MLPIRFQKLNTDHFSNLHTYLNHLSAQTKNRYSPHPFHISAIEEFYADKTNIGYIAVDEKTNDLIAYTIIKQGYLAHDSPRLANYGLFLNESTDATFAPSVADAWQGQGIGKLLFQFILNDLQNTAINRIILWGGVQKSNAHAIRFYEKLGFCILGEFEHNGMNVDMALEWKMEN